MISAYFHIAKRRFLDKLVYRLDFYTGLVLGVIYLFVRVAVWRGLYGGREMVAETTLLETITYTVIASLVAHAISIRVSADVEDKIHTGDLAYDLLRPVSPRVRLFAESFGDIFGDIIIRSVPPTIVGVLVFGLLPPASIGHLLAAFATLALGVLIILMLELIFTSLGFWLLRTRPVSNFYNAFAALLSGSIVPLWFFPTWLRGIADALPFKLAAFVPIAFYMGKIPMSELGLTLLTQIVWIVALGSLQQLLWSRGIRRMVIQGG